MADLRPGENICVIYENAHEQLSAVVPFLTAGLSRGERCVCVADGRTIEELPAALHAANIDVAGEHARGSLLLVTLDQYLSPGAEVTPEAMFASLQQRVGHALTDGFPALRLGVEMTETLSAAVPPEQLCRYEALANQAFFPTNQVVALCQYNRGPV